MKGRLCRWQECSCSGVLQSDNIKWIHCRTKSQKMTLGRCEWILMPWLQASMEHSIIYGESLYLFWDMPRPVGLICYLCGRLVQYSSAISVCLSFCTNRASVEFKAKRKGMIVAKCLVLFFGLDFLWNLGSMEVAHSRSMSNNVRSYG